MTAVLTCIAALAIVPSAFAHHGRISASMDCQGVVSYTASSWQTSNVLAKTHFDVRVYVVQSNGAAVNPAQEVGTGQFKSSNGFAFSGTFTVPASVNSVKLLVKEIGPWANGAASSNGTNQESSRTATRATSGCTPPPTDECPNIAGSQASVPAGMVKDASGNCVTPPPPPTDECPNIDGAQASVPVAMVKDSSGNCGTPSTTPPPTALVTATPAATPVLKAPVAKPKVAKVKKAKVTAKKKVVKTKRVVVKNQVTAKKTKPRALPFTP